MRSFFIPSLVSDLLRGFHKAWADGQAKVSSCTGSRLEAGKALSSAVTLTLGKRGAGRPCSSMAFRAPDRSEASRASVGCRQMRAIDGDASNAMSLGVYGRFAAVGGYGR